MFDFFRKHTWLLQIVLGFVVLAFVGGGVYQGYGSFMNDDNTTVAKVDGKKITEDDVRTLANWRAGGERTDEIPFMVARVLLQDFTGVPLLVDLAAMREAVRHARDETPVARRRGA